MRTFWKKAKYGIREVVVRGNHRDGVSAFGLSQPPELGEKSGLKPLLWQSQKSNTSLKQGNCNSIEKRSMFSVR